jgi:DNA-binding NtrC family response regulator
MCRVLIVDDDGVGPAIAIALQAHGYIPVVFRNFFAVMPELQRTSFDVAIVDRLPMQADGATLSWILHKRAPGLPIVVIANTNDETAGRAPLGYDPVCANVVRLQRPFRPQDLIAAIGLAVERTVANVVYV